jgi:alpha-D-xyloside xylohydrolase
MPSFYELPTFLPAPVPIELAAELERLTLSGNTVRMRCRTQRYEPELHNYYGTVAETVWREPTPGQPLTVQLNFCTPEVIRLRMARGEDVPDNPTPMVVGEFTAPVVLTKEESANQVTIRSDALRVVITREPWQIDLFDHAGAHIWSTRPLDLDNLRRPSHQWHPTEQRWVFYHRYAYPAGTADHGDARHAFLSFDLRYDEHIYGFGEQYGRLDKRHTRQRLWQMEGFSNATPGSYKHIPFFMSTRGYGFYINTSNAIDVRVGELEHTALSVTVDDTAAFDGYLIYGPTLQEVLPRYTAITGQPALPPKWSFGLWMGRISYDRQSQVEAIARELRDHRIPCDVIHIDTNWFAEDWQCDLRFGAEKFPDPAGMTARLREQGYRVSLWQWPNTIVTTSLFTEASSGGYLATRHNGQPYTFSGFENEAAYIDYSNPAAVAWIQEKFRALFRLGIAAIKVDFGEGASPDADHHGASAEAIHNLYPLLYNQAVFEVTEAFWGQGQGIIWARSAWAGSQRYPVHWSGDGIARYEDLTCVLRAALSFGMSGFPFYSHDIGGFVGNATGDLYARWAQLGLFSSHARAHGVPPREPWAYGEEAETIFRTYDELRYRLMPYIYSEAVECTRTSLPMLRALVLAFQDDPTTAQIEDQYLFGASLLIAPILTQDGRRRVYLPPGDWIDFWSKERLAGPSWLAVDVPLATMPMYVRAGAILPFGPLMQYVDELPLDPLTLEIYHPQESGGYVIHDANRPDIHVDYRREGGRLIVETTPAPGQIEIVIYGFPVTSAQVNGDPVAVEAGADGAGVVRFRGEEACIAILGGPDGKT